MAATRKNSPAAEPAEKPAPRAATKDDAGAAEVQAAFDEATAKGYFGSVPDEHPNSAYSLASGPDGPPVNPDRPVESKEKMTDA